MEPRLIFILKTALSAAFFFYGLQKLGGFVPAIEMYERLGFGQAPRYMTGSAETLGALVLWWRGREVFACLLLLGTMAIATFALLAYLGPPYAPVPYLSAGVVVLAWHYRWQLRRLLA